MSGPRRFEGRRALVTGSTNGIGAAILLGLAREGARVFITGRHDREAGRAVEASLPSGSLAGLALLDLGQPGAATELFRRAEAALGGIDLLVNNAAATTRTSFLQLTEPEWNRTHELNLRVPFVLLRHFARALVARGSPGAALNISSISAHSAISRMVHYQCTKAGLNMLTRGAALELAEHGIRVNTLSPGLTATAGNRDQWEHDPELWAERGKNIPLGRAARPADLVGPALFLLSDEARWITGSELIADGGESTL